MKAEPILDFKFAGLARPPLLCLLRHMTSLRYVVSTIKAYELRSLIVLG